MMENLIIVSGLSGAGKTTLVDYALKFFPDSRKVLTCTTRKMRRGEENGVHYRFYTRRQFTIRRECGQFAESKSSVYGNMYGTRKEDILSACGSATLVFLIVDIQGLKTLSKLYPKSRKIFITAETGDLAKRLTERSMSAPEVHKRIKTIARENEQMLKLSLDVIIENKNDELEYVQKLFCALIQNMVNKE